MIPPKLLESIAVVKLETGELLISMVPTLEPEIAILAFPYEIKETSGEYSLVRYCPFTATRTFPIPTGHIIFFKDASQQMKEIYADSVQRHENSELNRFLIAVDFSSEIITHDVGKSLH